MESGFSPSGIELFPRLERLGRFVGQLVTGPHLLASHGDNFNRDFVPFEEDIEMGTYFDGADVSDWPPYEAPKSDPYAPNGWSAPQHEQLTFPCYYREGERS